MPKRIDTDAHPSSLQDILHVEPLPDGERLYVGIDIGKESHYAAFCSPTLLKRHQSWTHCPWLLFDRSRPGFERLITTIEHYAPLNRVIVLYEATGPYSRAIEQYLLERGITCYRQHVTARPDRLLKNDRRDSQALAHLVYTMIEKGVQPTERSQDIRRVSAESPTVAQLLPMVQHHYQLGRQMTRLSNQLTAICDELFPELTQVYKDSNSLSALALREAFSAPAAVASATIEQLCATRRTRPSREALVQLQELARTTIGTKDASRVASLILKQRHMIATLRILQAQHEECETLIKQMVGESREGKILLSIPCVSPIQAASILAAIGSIERFAKVSQLRAYSGWGIQAAQTGSTLDTAKMSRGGNVLLRQAIFFCTMQALKMDGPWKTTYQRLVERKCELGADGKYKGKMKCVADIAGRLVRLIYALLKKDAEALAQIKLGEPMPEPVLYDHKKHAGSL